MVETAEGFETLSEPVRGRPIFSYSTPEMPFLRRWVIRSIERVSGRARFEGLYRLWQRTQIPGAHIFAECIRILGFDPQVSAEDMARIPKEGPLLVVSNHPFGIADGLSIGHVIAKVRPDVKLICHSLLCDPHEARDVLMPIDFGEGPEARRTSAETRRKSVEWLDQGHALIIFPAGGVATSLTPFGRNAADFLWHPFVGRLARRAGVKTLPIYVPGRNSRLFQLVSHYSYVLRIALIYHETRRRLNKPLAMRIGDAVACDGLGKGDVVAHLRALTYAMAEEGGPQASDEFTFPARVQV